jgi:hypothetical protein
LVETVQITGPRSLAIWLETQPTEWRQVIAVRAALRVLPLALDVLSTPHASVEELQRVCLSAFRAAFISWAACTYPAYDMAASLTSSAEDAINVASGAEGTADALPTVPTMRDVYFALFAVGSAAANDVVEAAVAAANAVVDQR